MLKHNHHPFTMEITVISAEGLKNTASSVFSSRLRPFITLTTCKSDNHSQIYTTRIDNEGGINPKWGDKFHVPINNTFFTHRYSSIYLKLYTKRLITGQREMGWCQIPAADIRTLPVGSVQYLSYRIRSRDGCRSHGVVNLAIKLECAVPVGSEFQTVIGIPAVIFPPGNSGEWERQLCWTQRDEKVDIGVRGGA